MASRKGTRNGEPLAFLLSLRPEDELVWPFARTHGRGSYARMYWQGELRYAYQVHWEILNKEPWPRDDQGHRLQALHSCHRGREGCANGHHVTPGTPQRNMEEMMQAGRHASKLSDGEVLETRRLYATGDWLQRELAEKFGVSEVTISDITRRRTWKHL